jgi:amino acid adenylation domain-containing protein
MLKILGNFASLYPLEVDLRGDGSFVDRTRRLQQQILRDSDHKQWGGMQVMQAFNRLKGEFGTVPCPYVVGSGLFMGGYKKADFSCLETSQTIMDHQFWELADGRYYYVWDLLEEFFPSGLIDSMWRAFDALLRTLAADRDYWQHKALLLASPPEIETPAGADDMPVPAGLLHRGLSPAAARTPDKPVLQTPAGDMTYRELDAMSNAVAMQLNRLQVRANELVAIMMERNASLLAAAVGILKAGAAYVPIDIGLPAERVAYLLDNTGARVVLTQKHHQTSIGRANSHVTVIAVDDLEPEDGAGLQQADVSQTDLAYVIYTSGSTGQPKGVMIEHSAALNTVVDVNRRFGIGIDDKVFGVSSFSFDLSVYDVFGVLEAGATLVYPSPAAAYNPAHWLDVMKSAEVTVWNSAPPLMSLLVETALRQNVTLPRLRLVMLSGDWIPVDLPAMIKRVAPNAGIISLGGATEAAIWSIYYPIDKVDPAWVSIPYGKPLANQGWQIRDTLGRRTPLWTVGELFITGVGLARGYWRDDEKTNRSFITDADSGERLYRTGDMGRYLPDGNIEFMGRIDAQVKIQGHRIELGEVEAAMHESPLVREVVVLALPVATGAQGAAGSGREKQLVAYVVPADKTLTEGGADPTQTIRALQAFLKEKLPVYMVPAGWSFLESLPITRNGKIDRKALEKVAYSGGEQTAENKNEFIAPRSEMEKQLAGIWQRVLPRQSIGINEDFFEIGGKSFDAVRCVALVQEHFGVTLSLGDIWQTRTIENLAGRIEQGRQADTTQRLLPMNTGGEGRPCFLVHPGGGQIVGYYPLAERLTRPGYAFLALAEDVDSGGLDSIEIAASRYAHLLQQQSAGPYTLAGWSSGGCIAFEMAVQLEAAGQRVDRVVMIDAPAPLQHEPIGRIDMLKGFFEDLGLGLPVRWIDDLKPAGDTQHEFEQIVTMFNRDALQAGPHGTVQLDAGQLYPIYRVFKACVDAVRNYRQTQKVAAEIVVLRAADGVVTEFADHPCCAQADWGWTLFASGPVSCATLEGTHHTLLKPPNVNAVAKAINAPHKAAGSEA